MSSQSAAFSIPDAMALHQQGRIADAERCYDYWLSTRPSDPQLLHLKGVARQQQGDAVGAIGLLSRAALLAPRSGLIRIALAQSLWSVDQREQALREIEEAWRCEPAQPAYGLTLASFLDASGQTERAIGPLLEIIARQPANDDALTKLGNFHWKLGRHSDAADWYRRALQLRVDDAGLHASLGSVLISTQQYDLAIASLRRALELRPDYSQALNNLGNALRNMGQIAEALEYFDRAIAVEPQNATYYDNRGLAHKQADRVSQALDDFRHAAALDAGLLSAHLHLALVLREQSQTMEAMQAFETAYRLSPDDSTAANGIACCLFDQHRFSEARLWYERTLQLDRTAITSWENLASCASEQGDLDLAARCCDEANRLDPAPRHAIRKALRLSPILGSRAEMLARRHELKTELRGLLANDCRLGSAVNEIRSAPFYVAYHGENERELLSFLGDFYAQVDPGLNFVAPHCQRSHRNRARKLRVGFLSRFFCNHSVGLHFGGMIREMNHDDFEIVILRVSHPDDEVARAIVGSADETIDLAPQFHRARSQVADCELDILIYTDIGMDYFTYFLAYSRLAPLQAVLAGHPLTTGLPTIDYFFSNDQMEPADGDSHYREQLVRMKNLMTRFESPACPPPGKRSEWGFSDHEHLYVCPQSLFKMHPDFDPILGEILRRDPAGRLVLFQADSADWSQLLMRRFQTTIPDVVSAIRWLNRLPMVDFLRFLQVCDVVLDTPHFNGGTTSLLALSVDSPIVTLPGRFMRGRTTQVCYDQMGFRELLAESGEEYVEIATAVACDPGLRMRHRQAIHETKGSLSKTRSVVHEFEECLLRLWETPSTSNQH